MSSKSTEENLNNCPIITFEIKHLESESLSIMGKSFLTMILTSFSLWQNAHLVSSDFLTIQQTEIKFEEMQVDLEN